MKPVFYLLRRNLVLFLRNKLNILLSFASIAVVLGVYALFLRDFTLDAVQAAGIVDAVRERLTDRFMLSGLFVVVNTTTCFGAVQICVNDNATGRSRDYRAAPVSPAALILGHWLTATLLSFFFTLCTAGCCELFFFIRYQAMPALPGVLRTIATLLLSSGVNAGILLCFAKELHSTATFSTFANLYGTLIGFLAGVYLPYSFYPLWLRHVLFYFPPAQAASLLRQAALCIPNPDFPAAVARQFGVCLELHGTQASACAQITILCVALVLLLFYLCFSEVAKNA